MTKFEQTYRKIMEELGADAGAMGSAPIVDASLDKPGTDTKDGVYVPARKFKSKKPLKVNIFKRIMPKSKSSV